MNLISANYFAALSWWISNLGVVPLLRFAALRRTPIFFLRFARLFFVIRVNETTWKLPNMLKQPPFLPLFSSIVKVLILLLAISNGYAGEQTTSLTLSRGEYKEIRVDPHSKFTVGNPEIISYKYDPTNGKILIKGKRIGFSEVMAWKGKKKTHSYHLYVYSKSQHMGLVQIDQQIQGLGLTSSWEGLTIRATGHLKESANYKKLINLLNRYKDKVQFDITLEESLKKYLLGEVYQQLFNEYIDYVQCQFQNILIHCKVDPEMNIPNIIKKRLNQNYHIQFTSTHSLRPKKNYQIKIKLIQLERLDGQELSLGLHQIIGSLGELINLGIGEIIKRNNILLKNHSLNLSTLAEPKGIIYPGSPLNLSIGQEIPYKTITHGQSTTTSFDWKFIGLRVSLRLERTADFFQVKYQTSFSNPAGGDSLAIGESKQSGKAKIWLNHPIKIFSVLYKTNTKNSNSLPLLGSIPLIGEMFKSKSKNSTFKSLTGVLVLEEIKI